MSRHVFPLSTRRQGFTLIELLIVIAIILILVAIALPNFLEAQIRSRVAKVKSELRTLDTAMQSYYLDWRIYPAEHERDEVIRTMRGFSWLTSPIAYVTGILQDPFAEFSADQDNTTFITYEMGGIEKFGNYFECGSVCMETWVMFSNGPDHGQEIWQQNPHYNSGRDIHDYSPTNGTKSRGEIFKWGGDPSWIGIQTETTNPLYRRNPSPSVQVGLTINNRSYLHTLPENK